jgi:regulatory protein
MRSEPQRKSSEAELYAAALRALMRRAHSTFELRIYLERRALDAAAVRSVLTRLKQEKLLDDGRYAFDFARARATGRRQGGRRIAQELRKRGVPDRHINAAIAQAFADLDESAIVRKVIERRTRTAHGPFAARPIDKNRDKNFDRNLDRKKVASLYRTLLRAGFDPAVIRRELGTALAGSVNDAPDFALPDENR